MNNMEKKYRYFLYSQSQCSVCENIESSTNREYIPGYVFYNGKKIPFTEISTVPYNTMYSDTKVVAKGYLEDLEYSNPTRKWRA